MKSKKLGKISSRTSIEIFRASVFDVSVHKTKRTCVWTEVLKEKK